MSLKFGLNLKGKGAAAPGKLAKPALGKKKALFGDDEEEAETKTEENKPANSAEEIAEFNFDDTTPKPSKPAPKSKAKPAVPVGPPSRKPLVKLDDPTTFENSASTAESERRAKEAIAVDATIYDYDAAYEAIHARTLAKKAAEREEADQRKPKYMENLFESAELRKKDQLRARDKILQREREAEGDEFADKDKFVTGAYKAQQEEARLAEEEEKKRQELEDEKKRKYGMTGFHKQMLLEEEKRHREAMEAAAELSKQGVKPVAEEPLEREKTEAEIAAELKAKGRNIILTEDGQVADKRQLLSAGLNILAEPKKSSTTPSTTSTKPTGPPSGLTGRNAQRAEIRARHTQMVAQQIEAANKRKADDEAEQQAKLQHAAKSQKTEGEIMSAKERYLQRKREAEAAKKAAVEGK